MNCNPLSFSKVMGLESVNKLEMEKYVKRTNKIASGEIWKGVGR